MIEAFSFAFMQHAAVAALLAAVAIGVVGPLAVVNRLVFLSGGIAHASFGGIGIALYLGISPLLGAWGFAFAIALLLGWWGTVYRQGSDSAIGAVWAIGMALGVVFSDMTPGYQGDLMRFLFGNILTVPVWELGWMALLDGVIMLVVGLWYRQLVAVSYDPEFARLRGIPSGFFQTVILLLVALAVVVTIRVVGLVLVMALMTMPVLMVQGYTVHLWRTMIGTAFLAALLSLAGLWLSFVFNLPTGAMIILLTGVCFILWWAGRSLRR